MYIFVNYGEIYDLIWFDLIWFESNICIKTNKGEIY